MNQQTNLFCVSGTSPTGGCAVIAPAAPTALATSLPLRFTDSSRQEDMLHIHERLYDVWLTTRGSSVDSREAGILSSELWKQIVNDKSPQKAPSHEMPPQRDSLLYKIALARTQKRIRRNATKPFTHVDDGSLHFHKDDLEGGYLCYCNKCVDSRNELRLRNKKLRRGLLEEIASIGAIHPYVRWTELFHRISPEIICSETSHQAIDRGVQVGPLHLIADVPRRFPFNTLSYAGAPSISTTAKFRRMLLKPIGFLRRHNGSDTPAVTETTYEAVSALDFSVGRTILIGKTEQRTPVRLKDDPSQYSAWRKTDSNAREIQPLMRTTVKSSFGIKHQPLPESEWKWEPSPSTPDTAEFMATCDCPRSKPDKKHPCDMFVYPDGSVRYECARDYLMVFKSSPLLMALSEINDVAVADIVKERKKWSARLKEKGLSTVVYVKRGTDDKDKDKSGHVLDMNVDEDGNADGDEIDTTNPAEAIGLDWIEDAKPPKESFDIDAEEFLKLVKRFYGVETRLISREELLNDPHFSEIAWAYRIRTRYAEGDEISESEKRQIRRRTNYMIKSIEGKCPSGTCPNDRCANTELTFAERRDTHAGNLPEMLGKWPDHVGEWYCVVDLNGQPRIKWLPDVSKFDGETEQDRVEAAFDELVRIELLAAARHARKNGGDPEEAQRQRQAAFDAVSGLYLLDSVTSEDKAQVPETEQVTSE